MCIRSPNLYSTLKSIELSKIVRYEISLVIKIKDILKERYIKIVSNKVSINMKYNSTKNSFAFSEI